MVLPSVSYTYTNIFDAANISPSFASIVLMQNRVGNFAHLNFGSVFAGEHVNHLNDLEQPISVCHN